MMQVGLGKHKFEHHPIIWDATDVINGHWMLVGSSGTGKTFTLKKVARAMVRSAANDVRVHVFDVHGDIDFESDCSEVRFSEQTEYGFNPFVINPDQHDGGVRKCVQNFINVVNKTSRKLGNNQEAVLRNLLYDLFAANGFYADNPKSWVLNDGIKRRFPKKYPTLSDAYRFALSKLKRLYTGADSKAGRALESLNAEVAKFQRKAAKDSHGDAMEDIEQQKTKLIESYTEYVQAIENGKELDDMIRYGNKDTLSGIVNRLDSLQSVGIFKNQPPPFDNNQPIWRYNIKSLNTDERKLFVLFKMWDIYRTAMSQGQKDYIDTVVILDEGHIYMDDDEDNITNLFAKEIRKFGVAMVTASQSTKHYPADIVKNCATKIVLGVDESEWSSVVRDFNLEKKSLEYVVPRRQILVQMKKAGAARNRFETVSL